MGRHESILKFFLSDLSESERTFASGFDDLREDVLGDVVTVLHSSLSFIDPLSPSSAEQVARILRFLDELPVVRLVLQTQSSQGA